MGKNKSASRTGFAKEEKQSSTITMTGVVTEAFPSAKFAVKLENDFIVNAHISGKIRKNDIKILVGDTVQVEVSPYDLTKGRITYRERKQR